MKVEIEKAPQTSWEHLASEVILGPVEITNERLADFLTLNYKRRHNKNNGKNILPDLISERTGTQTRFALQELYQDPKDIKETVPSLAIDATKRGLAKRGWEPESLEGLFVATSYPFSGRLTQIVSDEVKAKNCLQVEAYAACSGIGVLLTEVFKQKLMTKGRIALVAPEHYTAKMDMDLNRRIFSDGVSILLIELGKEVEIVYADYIHEENDAIKMPIEEDKIPDGSITVKVPNDTEYFAMDGERVKNFLRDNLPRLLTESQLELGSGNYRVFDAFHQASSAALITVRESLDPALGIEVKARTLGKYANLAAGSVLGETHAIFQEETLQRGDFIRMTPFGAGLCAAVVVLRVISPSSPN